MSDMTTVPIPPSIEDVRLHIRDAAAVDTLRAIREIAEDDDAPQAVRRMAAYILEYLFDPALDFNGIIASAQRPDLDTAEIAGLFAGVAGSPPMAFVETGRCEIASRLTGRDDLTLLQIAHLVGFPSHAAFARALRRTGPRDPEGRAWVARLRSSGSTSADVESILGNLAGGLSGPGLCHLLAAIYEHLPAPHESA